MKKPYKLSETQEKILKGMDIVWERLVESKRKSGGELVVIRDGKIVRIKP